MTIPLNIIKDSYDISTSLFDRYQKWQELQKDNSVRLKLLELECKKNLDLLNTVITDSKKLDKELKNYSPLKLLV